MTLLAYLAAQDPADPARHRRRRAALAQSGADRRAGRDARPADRRAVRFRRRQGLPQGRVRRLLHPDRGGLRALRRGDRGHPQGLDLRGPLLPPRQALELREHPGRAGAAAAPAPAAVAGGRQPDSIRRAAREGFNLLLDQLASVEQIGERIALYRAECEAVGPRLPRQHGRHRPRAADDPFGGGARRRPSTPASASSA